MDNKHITNESNDDSEQHNDGNKSNFNSDDMKQQFVMNNLEDLLSNESNDDLTQNKEETKEDDLMIFTNLDCNECTKNNDSNDNHTYIQNCDSLKRIAIAIKYYQLFRQNKIKNKSITQFYQNIYPNVNILNDHCHFISKQNYDTIEIIKEMEKEYKIKPCVINECDVISRHYRQEINEKKSENSEENDNDNDDIRFSWNVNSIYSIFSRSQNKWFRGEIIDIYIDIETNKEWFIVKYDGNKKKSIQRLSKDIKPYKSDINDDNNNNDIDDDNDKNENFLIDSFDRLHHHLFHHL